MLVDFKSLADSSKVWIYQSNRELTRNEMDEIIVNVEKFVSTWKRHGDDLKASYQIRYNQFIILAVDEEFNGVSGCSVDASTHMFKQFEQAFKIDLFNKLNTAFEDGDNINIVSLAEFQKYVKERKINAKTIVFNNLVKTKKELNTAWEVDAANSWHSRYL
jgi:hypothetical protein